MKRALGATPRARGDSPACRAQESLGYEAWQATSGAQQALALWPDCVDACVLAQPRFGRWQRQTRDVGRPTSTCARTRLPQGTSRSAATSRWVNSRWLRWRSPRLGEFSRERSLLKPWRRARPRREVWRWCQVPNQGRARQPVWVPTGPIARVYGCQERARPGSVDAIRTYVLKGSIQWLSGPSAARS
jgi:hypothetical protein